MQIAWLTWNLNLAIPFNQNQKFYVFSSVNLKSQSSDSL
jgi:hypothetical protein